MKKLWIQLRRRWWALLILVGAIASVATALLLRRGPPAPEKVMREIEAIEAGKKAAEMAAVSNHEVAVAALELEHKETLAALDEKQAAKAAKLKRDPELLARYLVRMGKM